MGSVLVENALLVGVLIDHEGELEAIGKAIEKCPQCLGLLIDLIIGKGLNVQGANTGPPYKGPIRQDRYLALEIPIREFVGKRSEILKL